MTSTNGNRELEAREDKKLHVHLWCNVAWRSKNPKVAQYSFMLCILKRYFTEQTPNSLGKRQSLKYCIYLATAALEKVWTNRKLKGSNLYMGFPDRWFKKTESEV